MAGRVFVTGLGIVSAAGTGVAETLAAVRMQHSGVRPMTRFALPALEGIPVCEVPASHEELLMRAEVHPRKNTSRTALLGLIAAREAIASARIDTRGDAHTGCISATSVGGMDITEQFYTGYVEGGEHVPLAQLHDCGHSTEFIAEALDIGGFTSTISTACSGSANAIMLGARLIRSGLAERVIAGGSDALTRFTLNGFASLMVLSKTGCKPFDEKRDGITLGEGAGYLVLESEESAVRRKAEPLCVLSAAGNACDAFHQTATSPQGDGPFLAMTEAMGAAGLSPEDIDYVNAHGTGTVNNDLSEGLAIQRVFGTQVPPLSSTKGFTGHCLGASGGLEAVLSVLAIRHSMLIPQLHFTERMKELSFSPYTAGAPRRELRHVLSNSFGFGGNNTALIFSRC